jgi:ribonuclease P protein component
VGSFGCARSELACLSLSRHRRVRKRREYLLVQQEGTRISLSHFILLIRDRSDELPPRLGITVTRKCGTAVERNRIKRYVRETFRLNPDWLPSGIDLVVIAKSGTQTAEGFGVVARELLRSSSRVHQQVARLRSEVAKTRNRPQTGGSTEGFSS